MRAGGGSSKTSSTAVGIDWMCRPAKIDLAGQRSFIFAQCETVCHHHCVTAACHSTRFSCGSRLICLDSHERHLASLWRFSAILWLTYLLTYLLIAMSRANSSFSVLNSFSCERRPLDDLHWSVTLRVSDDRVKRTQRQRQLGSKAAFCVNTARRLPLNQSSSPVTLQRLNLAEVSSFQTFSPLLKFADVVTF